MKTYKKLIVLIIFFLGLTSNVIAKQITLFDSDGDAIAYIDTNDDLTIYLWSGKPVAYLESKGSYFNIYGFNGKHLGWFEDGIIIDHKGYAVGFTKGSTNVPTKYEPYKSYKSMKPYKSYKEYAPYKPYCKSRFSIESLALFLSKGNK